MALESVTRHLYELAEAEGGLRRSRVMAQLWADIRKASPEERRILGHALADRFAPALAERFESVTGIEGPEFIELVRRLIDVEADDIRGVIDDLRAAAADPASVVDEITVGDAMDASDRASTAEGRDELVDQVFDRLTGEADQIDAEDEVSAAALDAGDLDSETLAQAVEALDELPESAAAPSAYQQARERLREIEEESEEEADAGPAEDAGSRTPADRPLPLEHPPVPLEEASARSGQGRAARLAERLAETPDGWKRRRLLSAAIRRDEVDAEEALELSDLLSSRVDRGWIAGDLIARGLSDDERGMLRDRDLPRHIIRRLERMR